MSLTRKVAYNTTVQIIGKVLTTLISLVLVAAFYFKMLPLGIYTPKLASPLGIRMKAYLKQTCPKGYFAACCEVVY